MYQEMKQICSEKRIRVIHSRSNTCISLRVGGVGVLFEKG